MTTRTERKKAKLRFVTLYSISLLLLFILASAFWRRLAPGNTQSTAPQTAEKDAWFLQIDTALHTKMEAVDALTATYVRARKDGGQADTGGWLLMRQSVGKTIDSLDQQAGYLSDGPRKGLLTSLAANFRRALASREAVINGLMALPKGSSTVGTPASNSTVDSLKRLVQEKDEALTALQKQAQLAATNSGTATTGLQAAITERDKSIASLQTQTALLQAQLRQKELALQAASNSKPVTNNGNIAALQTQVTSLQNQLKQKDAALQAALKQAAANSKPVATNGGAEWQQKYQSLKASFDKVAASEKSLKGAYQTLADDNRRLLSQLQAARKG